jgi:hypothetical protein
MSSTRVIQTSGQLKLKSNSQDITFETVSGKNVILPARTDFSNCSTALNAQVDLSSKQDVLTFNSPLSESGGQVSFTMPSDVLTDSDIGNVEGGVQACSAKLNSISAASTSEGSVLRWSEADGAYIQGTAMVYNSKLNDIAGITSDATFLYYNGDNIVAKSASETMTLLNAEPADATILKESDIGVDIQAFNQNLSDISAISGMATNDLITYNGSALTNTSIGNLNLLTQSAVGTDIQEHSDVLDSIVTAFATSTNGQVLSNSSGNPAFTTQYFLNAGDIGVSLQGFSNKLETIKNLDLQTNDYIKWTPSGFVNRNADEVRADISAQTANGYLNDISNSSPSENDYLKFDGSNWVPAPVTGGGSYTFDAPLSESAGVVSLDTSDLMDLSSGQTVSGHKQFSGTVSYNENMAVQHRCESGTGYIHYKRDRLYKQAFEDTDPHNLFPNIYYANDREIVVDVEVSAIDVDSSPKRMHVHKLSCVTLNGSILSNQHEIVYEPASGDVLTFAFTLSGSNLNCTVTQASANRYVYSVFVVDRAVTNA